MERQMFLFDIAQTSFIRSLTYNNLPSVGEILSEFMLYVSYRLTDVIRATKTTATE